MNDKSVKQRALELQNRKIKKREWNCRDLKELGFTEQLKWEQEKLKAEQYILDLIKKDIDQDKDQN